MIGITIMMVDLMLLLLTIGLPFYNPWWFIPGFIVIILHYGYYEGFVSLVNKLMDE